MGNLDGRIRRLERDRPERGRCDTCRDWLGGRLLYTDPAAQALFERRHGPPGPERCSACGWAPVSVGILYIDEERSGWA